MLMLHTCTVVLTVNINHYSAIWLPLLDLDSVSSLAVLFLNTSNQDHDETMVPVTAVCTVWHVEWWICGCHGHISSVHSRLVCFRLMQFLETILQGSVATSLRREGFIANFLLNVPVEEFRNDQYLSKMLMRVWGLVFFVSWRIICPNVD